MAIRSMATIRKWWVYLDTTVLLGAFANPRGPNAWILRWGHDRVIDLVVPTSVRAEARTVLIRGNGHSIEPQTPDAADQWLALTAQPWLIEGVDATAARAKAGAEVQPEPTLRAIAEEVLRAAGLPVQLAFGMIRRRPGLRWTRRTCMCSWLQSWRTATA